VATTSPSTAMEILTHKHVHGHNKALLMHAHARQFRVCLTAKSVKISTGAETGVCCHKARAVQMAMALHVADSQCI